jgi:hypothetical protein
MEKTPRAKEASCEAETHVSNGGNKPCANALGGAGEWRAIVPLDAIQALEDEAAANEGFGRHTPFMRQ